MLYEGSCVCNRLGGGGGGGRETVTAGTANVTVSKIRSRWLGVV